MEHWCFLTLEPNRWLQFRYYENISGKWQVYRAPKQVYDIVLAANRKIVEAAKPGMTTKELNEVCKDVLADGLMKLGLIKNSVEISKYYMHGVSHHPGIDVHDVTVDSNSRLRPGAIISDEPGLYIDEWEIGIRIEDDVLITEDGAVCLSEDIIRTTEDIEAYMAEHKKELIVINDKFCGL